MGFLDVLKQYANPAQPSAGNAQSHFDEIAHTLPADLLGRGVTAALRSEQTPPFGDMVGQMFGRSNPQQQAGVLNQLLTSVAPGMLSGLAGGALGRLFGPPTQMPPTLTPEQASQLTPEQVRDIASHAEQQNPGIVDTIGNFYGQHPEIVKSIGAMALAVLMGKMAGHGR